MKKLRVALSAAAAVLLVSFSSAPAAQAADLDEPPVLLSASFEQSTVRMYDEAIIDWTVRDTGTMDDDVVFIFDNGHGATYYILGYDSERTGDIVRGQSSATITEQFWNEDVPEWKPGTYQVVGVRLTDEDRNVTMLPATHPVVAELPSLRVLPDDPSTPIPTPAPTVTASPTPTDTPTPTPTPTLTPTETPTAIPSPTTPEPTSSASPFPTETEASTALPTASDSPTTTSTPTPAPSKTTSAPTSPASTSITTPAASIGGGNTASPHGGDSDALASTGTDTLGPLAFLASSLLAVGAGFLLARKRGAKS